MLLAVDIGNTNIVLGLFQGKALVAQSRLTTPPNLTADEASIQIQEFLASAEASDSDIVQAVVGSVVPALTEPFCRAGEKLTGAMAVNVTSQIELPVQIDIDEPEQVGADRIANAAAGLVLHGGPVIVVDFGTATTFDVISGGGAYIGGVIIPGPQTAMADLARRAARLFEVPLEPPARMIGRSTEQALQSGMFYGTVGQVDYIVERIMAESGEKDHTILATGGLAGRIEKHSRLIQKVEPDLTLQGLRLIGEMN